MSLAKEDKLSIIDQHIRNIEYSIYGSQLDLIEAQAVASPDAVSVASINDRITSATAKKTALLAERAEVEAE
jgi:hypothetical protein